jgi:hypothetical protein
MKIQGAGDIHAIATHRATHQQNIVSVHVVENDFCEYAIFFLFRGGEVTLSSIFPAYDG